MGNTLQTPLRAHGRNQIVDASHEDRYSSIVGEHPSDSIQSLLEKFEHKLDAIQDNITRMQRETTKNDTTTSQSSPQSLTDAPASELEDFAQHVTIKHLLDWLQTIREHISNESSPTSTKMLRQIQIIADFIRNTNHDSALHFDTLLNAEQDEEMQKFLSDSLNPNANTTPTVKVKFSAVANAVRFSRRIISRPSFRQKAAQFYDIPTELQDFVDNVHTFDFDVFAFADACPKDVDGHSLVLYYMGQLAIRHFRLVEQFNLDMDRFRSCLKEANKNYLDSNPYHNAVHAADVVQTVVYFLSSKTIRNHLSDLDVLALILSAIFHDIQHPGHTNTFESRIMSEKAVLYNDQSILENHHASTCFKILYDDKFNFLSALNKNQQIYLRKVIIFLILGTDISTHFTSLAKIKETILPPTQFAPTNEEHVMLLMKLLLKCADINNPVKPLRLSKLWAYRVNNEFWLQGDKEKELDLPVSAFSDRDNADVPRSQVAFCRFIVEPLYACLVEFDETHRLCLETMEKNKTFWEAQIEEPSVKSPEKKIEDKDA